MIDAWSRPNSLAVSQEEAEAPFVVDPDRAAHAAALHRLFPGKIGAVSVMRRVVSKAARGEFRWLTEVVQPRDLPTSRALQLGSHIAVHSHFGRRRADRLAQCNAIVADVDYHSTIHRARSPEDVMAILEHRLYVARVPSPSYWMDTGRGLLAVWLIEELPAYAAPRVAAIQAALLGPKQTDTRQRDEREARNDVRMHEIWEGMGVDRGAVDFARVFRICGSINEKSGRRVRLMWPASWDMVHRYEVDELANAILPYSREEIAEMRAARAAAREAREQERRAQVERRAEEAALYGVEDEPVEAAQPVRRLPTRFAGGSARWQRRVDALMALVAWWGGSVPEGRRDLWAFHVAAAWANMGRGDLASWARELAPLCDLPERELRSCLSSVATKLEAARRGERVPYRGSNPAMTGTDVDPRYTPSAAKVRLDLGLTIEDAREACGEALVRTGAGATATERSADRRERNGCVRREATVEKRLADGAAAIALRKAGKTMKEIVAILGRGLTSLTRAMAEAAAQVATAIADAVLPSKEKAETENVHETARYLVAEPPQGADRRRAAPAETGPSTNVVPFPTSEAHRPSPATLPDRTLPMPVDPEEAPVSPSPWAGPSTDPEAHPQPRGLTLPPEGLTLPTPPGEFGDLAKALLAHPRLGKHIRVSSIVERPSQRWRAA